MNRLRVPNPDWMIQASCRDVPPGLMFPERGSGDQMNQAKAVCALCPVRAECLEYALDNHQIDGVWGGMSGKQRRTLIYKRGRAA